MRSVCSLVVAGVAVVAGAWIVARPDDPVAVVGTPEVVERAYDAWRGDRMQERSSGRFEIGLAWSRALSTDRSDAVGALSFDPDSGMVRVDARGGQDEQPLDVWLVDNSPTSSAAPDREDRTVLVGRLEFVAGEAELVRALDDSDLAAFDVDVVVASRAGQEPHESVVLAGMPTLFQRLASRERAAVASRALPSGLLLAAQVSVSTGGGSPTALPSLVAQGEQLFFTATFSGNGRTCGTCHPAQNNFTIDPTFIATLPPNDPLFVAEFVPELDRTRNGGLPFENPTLMRQFGLILENLDGFADLPSRFTMRSVPHVLGLAHSMTRPVQGGGPIQRTGWSADGAPGQGSLREFALGAVRQHFTRRMSRQPGIDFRFPTDAELDALEAFQLSLGRTAELDLSTLVLRDAGARMGQSLFDTAGCSTCHEDAGANRGFENMNFATGVEAFVRHHPDGTGQPRPPDGGLGTNGSGGTDSVVPTPEPDDPSVQSFGDKTFNVPSLVEFADSLPGFHNNLTLNGVLPNTVEGAIAFYDTIEFRDSPSGFVVGFLPGDIEKIGRFLRVINALENRRSADAYVARAIQLISVLGNQAAITRALDLAEAECNDAIDVLGAVDHLSQDAVEAFAKAVMEIEEARTGTITFKLAKLNGVRNRYLQIARTSLQL